MNIPLTCRISIESVLNKLQDNLSVLSSELIPLHERLVTIRRKLVALAAKGGSPKAELKPLQEELRKIDSLSICFLSPEGLKYSRSIFALMVKFLCLLGRVFLRLSSRKRVVNV